MDINLDESASSEQSIANMLEKQESFASNTEGFKIENIDLSHQRIENEESNIQPEYTPRHGSSFSQNYSETIRRLVSKGNKTYFDFIYQNKQFKFSTYDERKQFRLIEILSKDPAYRKTEEIDWLIQQTQDIEFFKNIINQGNEDIHRRCCQKMKYEYHTANSLIFKLGSYGNKFYIIIDGKAGVYIRNLIDYTNKKSESKSVIEQGDPKFDLVGGLNYFKELTNGMSFGELALLERKPRQASILCHTDLHVAVIAKDDFDQILKSFEEYKLSQAALFFDQIPPFSKWNQRRQVNLHLNANRQIFKINQVVYEEGSDPTSFYIIKSGTFAVMKRQVNNHKHIQKARENPNFVAQQIAQQVIFTNDSQQPIKKQVPAAPSSIQTQKKTTNAQQPSNNKNKSKSKKSKKSLKPSDDNSLLKLSPQQFQEYLSQKRMELNQTQSSDDEGEQDILFKKHELCSVKTKDAKFQKPISSKIAEVGQFQYFGEEEIALKCKKRVFTVVCTSAVGEVLQISKRDFELRVLTDTVSRNYIKDQIITKQEFYKTQLEKIGISIHQFNNYFFDSKLELNMVEKTTSNRDVNVVKNFLIGVDFIEEIADNKKKKRHYFSRIAKNELKIEDLINGSFINKGESKSNTQQALKEEEEKESFVLQDGEESLFGSQVDVALQQLGQEENIQKEELVESLQQKGNQNMTLSTLFPSKERHDNAVPLSLTEKNISAQMYQSKRILTPDRVSISVQQEYQIAPELMHQAIQDKVKEKLDKIKLEESMNSVKSSGFRKSAVLVQQLKKYRAQSQPSSPLSLRNEESSLHSQPNSPFLNFTENNQDSIQESLNLKESNTSKGGFWNTQRKKQHSSMISLQPKKQTELKNLSLHKTQSITTKEKEKMRENSSEDPNKQSKPSKKQWVDSYTLNFQDNLRKNLQEKFKGSKMNVNRIKSHLKQSAINLIPDEEFNNVPDSILNKPKVIIPQMDEKLKIFKRVVIKTLGVSKQEINNPFIKDLQDRLKEKHVQTIRDGFLSHLQNCLAGKKSAEGRFPTTNLTSTENSPIQTPFSFSRSSSIRGHNLVQSSLNLNNYNSANDSQNNVVLKALNKFRNVKTSQERKQSSLLSEQQQPYSPQAQIASIEGARNNLTHRKSNSVMTPSSINFAKSLKETLLNEQQSTQKMSIRILAEDKNGSPTNSFHKFNNQIYTQTTTTSTGQSPNNRDELMQFQQCDDKREQDQQIDSRMKNSVDCKSQVQQQPVINSYKKQMKDLNVVTHSDHSLKFPSNDTVKEESVQKDEQQSQELQQHIQLQSEQDSPIIFSPVCSPISSGGSTPFAQTKLFGNFAPRSASIFRQNQRQQSETFTVQSIRQSEQNLTRDSQQDQFVLGQEDKKDKRQVEEIENYFSNPDQLQKLRNMDYRFELNEPLSADIINKQPLNMNQNQLARQCYSSLENTPKSDMQMSYTLKQDDLSKDLSSVLGKSISKQERNHEYKHTLINKHMQHQRLFSLMTDQCGDDMKNLNVQEIKRSYKFKDQNPFFLAQQIGIDPHPEMNNMKRLSQQELLPENPFKYEEDLKIQENELTKQMDKFLKVEKEIHTLKPKTNLVFLQAQSNQAMSLESIVSLQKNLHKRNRTEMPNKLTTKTKEASAPVYKFQVEKMYSDKIRSIKAKQQIEEIERKNEFFNKISTTQQQQQS